MKVLVLGAGVVGTATAWYLAKEGHEVTVLERQPGAGLETSFANGGQVSACHAEPWASPGAPGKILRWLLQDDAPLLFRPRLDAAQWRWGWEFLRECAPARYEANVRRIAALSLYSRGRLQALRAETGIAYDHLARGILHYYTDTAEFEAAARAVELMRGHGLDREVKSRAEAMGIEPALAHAGKLVVGATYTPSDESGDAHVFTRNLAALAGAKGADFRYGHTVIATGHGGGELTEVVTRDTEGQKRSWHADAYVVALGSYSPLIAAPLGFRVPVYPAKGYSVTVDVTDATRAPTVALTDDGAKLVFSRLGNRLRIAGTAELSGYSTTLNEVRCASIVRRARQMFPGAADFDRPALWTGLRPATPSNVPVIGRTPIRKLYMNTGHGTLGWTMACGSGAALADIISGRQPEVDFPFS
ncbi:D-amino acid dehydrogenase [Usitatibacter palustris]|uniref:D-amino acid dehydrogenase n=1 Tax=Usitatibacter palustris TaxID=2732487 RepID=A0A6M4H8Y0_9PROT|nr:D-amino acid dehydrogenase [Usitatibacter palustris]QJR16056.1 D-amino acid dehydrogenase 1 [Usitatibacter palustris]